MKKVTFSFDDESILELDFLSSDTGIPRSRIIRDLIHDKFYDYTECTTYEELIRS